MEETIIRINLTKINTNFQIWKNAPNARNNKPFISSKISKLKSFNFWLSPLLLSGSIVKLII